MVLAKNYESVFTLLKVMEKKTAASFFGHGVYNIAPISLFVLVFFLTI